MENRLHKQNFEVAITCVNYRENQLLLFQLKIDWLIEQGPTKHIIGHIRDRFLWVKWLN